MPETTFTPAPVVHEFRPAVLEAAPGAHETPEHEHARAAGFAAGYAAGARRAAADAAQESMVLRAAAAQQAADVERRLAASLALLAHAAQTVRALSTPVLLDATAAVHAGALELAADVLGSELADGDRSARAALGRVLAAEPTPGPVTVRLHPRDLAALAGCTHDVDPDVALVADPTLQPGDAVAEHTDGSIDARIGAALERARVELARTADGS